MRRHRPTLREIFLWFWRDPPWVIKWVVPEIPFVILVLWLKHVPAIVIMLIILVTTAVIGVALGIREAWNQPDNVLDM